MNLFRCYNCMKEYDIDAGGLCPYCNNDPSQPTEKPFYIKPGTVLENQYMIGKAIGSGGFGITYKAWDFQLERKVAIKEYYPSGIAARQGSGDEVCVKAGDDADKYEFWLRAFIDEALRLASMDSLRGIVHIFNSFVANSTAYIVMEYLEGNTLKGILKENEKPLDYKDVIDMVVPALYSLDAIHKANIIHRDIAPDNIMKLPDGKIKIFDFGSAKNSKVVSDNDMIAILVKPGYSAVEQYEFGGTQGPWTDVYSMSAVMYHLITGIRPAESIKRRDEGARIQAPSQLGIDIPSEIEDIIMSALSLDARYRIRSARDFADKLSYELKKVREKEEEERKKASRWSKKTKAAITVAAVVTFFAIGLILLSLTPGNSLRDYTGIVENIEGKSSDEALRWGKENDIKVKFIGTIRTDNPAENSKVVWQDYAQGYRISRDESDGFVLKVKTGVYDIDADEYNKDSIKMPDLVGKKYSEAVSILEKAGFVNYKIEARKNSEKIKSGCICEQSVKKGTVITADTEIFVVVSKGDYNSTGETNKKDTEKDNGKEDKKDTSKESKKETKKNKSE